MKFTPDPTYEGLLKQANAMSLLINTLEARTSLQEINIQKLYRELCVQSYDEMNSLRDTIHILTNEVESLEAKLEEHRKGK